MAHRVLVATDNDTLFSSDRYSLARSLPRWNYQSLPKTGDYGINLWPTKILTQHKAHLTPFLPPQNTHT